ncbi:hypothetical protein C4G95_RS18335 [Vibrio parahaemolyticus]|nr:hypothetical protein [Vibrio parahaemolyticus]
MKKTELEKFLIGMKLGEGRDREVFELDTDSTAVIKVAKGFNGIAANINEWQMWNACYNGQFYADLKRWLAPCITISECGKYLAMRRTTTVSAKQAPTVVPAIFYDTILANIGWYEDRIVFHDYGDSSIIEEAICRKRAKIIEKSAWE